MGSSTEKQVIDLIKRSEKILVMPSSPPDGDSLGSAIALYMALKKMGKEVTVVCSDPIPELLQFLPNIKVIGNQIVSSNDFIITLDCRNTKLDTIKSLVEDDKVNIVITPKSGRFSEDDVSFNKGTKSNYDLIITVDCAELTQLKSFYENNIEMFHQIPVINIDHHISNTHFGKINYVDIMASSTTELLLPIFEELSREENVELIDEDTATLLLTGIITDTGSFQNANTTPKSFAKAAQLISYGARQQEIIQNIYKTKQLSQLKLWGRVLSKIKTDETHRIIWSTVSQQDFRDTGSTEDQTADVIDELMTNAPEAEIVILIKERKDAISVSIRTTTQSVDASKIADHFGGGGHVRAAGFSLSGKNLLDAEHEIISYLRGLQAERFGLTETEKPADFKPFANDENEEVVRISREEKPAKSKKKTSSRLNIKSPTAVPDTDITSAPTETEIEPGITYRFEE